MDVSFRDDRRPAGQRESGWLQENSIFCVLKSNGTCDLTANVTMCSSSSQRKPQNSRKRESRHRVPHSTVGLSAQKETASFKGVAPGGLLYLTGRLHLQYGEHKMDLNLELDSDINQFGSGSQGLHLRGVGGGGVNTIEVQCDNSQMTCKNATKIQQL